MCCMGVCPVLENHRAEGLQLAQGIREGLSEVVFKTYTFKGRACFTAVCLELRDLLLTSSHC